MSVPSSSTTTSGRSASGPIDPSAAATVRRSAASAASSTSVGLTGADPNLGAISTRGDLDQPLALREHLARQGATLAGASERRWSPVGPAAASSWAGSGGMHLTGWPGRPPLLDGWPALAAASEVAELVADLAWRRGRRMVVDAPEVLFGRAALARWQRAGRTSAGGSCRLLEAVDGWLAVNLARPDDVDAVPAVVEAGDLAADPWRLLGEFAARSRAIVAAERCQLLGVPAAALGGPDTGCVEPVSVAVLGPARARPAVPLVVDLSGLWAGPLCARLLGEAGARVVKVEAHQRLDGARRGDRRFYDWLHAGHESVVLDLTSAEGRGHLHRLLERADIVIEASRPRALSALGVDAGALVARTGLTWVSITGYGREGSAAELVAFGDDAAVAGGLVAADAAGAPVFCADAVADPLTGLYAAAAALAVEGGALVSVPMAGVAAHALARGRALWSAPCAAEVVATGPQQWAVRSADGSQEEVREPRPPRLGPLAAAEPGRHTVAVLAELGA